MKQAVDVRRDKARISDDVELYYELRVLAKQQGGNDSHTSAKLVMITGAHITSKHYDDIADKLVRTFPGLEVLTFDNRGVGRSTKVAASKQTPELLAEDTLKLINSVWGRESQVHVHGVSMGGMIAQKLGLMLLEGNRLKSMYLGATWPGYWYNPMKLLGLWGARWLMTRIIKPQNVMIKDMILPMIFPDTEFPDWSPERLEEERKRYADIWRDDFDSWFAFGDIDICAAHLTVAFNHYLSPEEAQALRDSGVPITVQIATRDPMIPPSEQRKLASMLNATCKELEQGPATRNEATVETVIEHFRNVLASH